ncbi:MAG: MmcQ/YjbR family DNA-binding protein [Chloroflexi bacterium]|nr:MmcQ/YjbR family DNA-binding protein [Chloroflexota bacterium]
MTMDEVRALVAELPEAVESAHHNHPDFRVRKKIFATLWPPKNRCNLRLPGAEAHALINTEPDKYSLISDRDPIAWVAADLEHCEPNELRELLASAWQLVAPPALSAALEEEAQGNTAVP